MRKIDLKKQLRLLYAPSSRDVQVVDVPLMKYLMIDGEGAPQSAAYRGAVEALFSVSYAVKFLVKKGAQQIDYGVMPLEGLWWADDEARFSLEDRRSWAWTAMIVQPEFVSAEMFLAAREQTGKKNPNPALSRLRLEPFCEGKAAQILHIGPYEAEGPSIAKLHECIRVQGGTLTGKHHEIYLSDPGRTAAEKLKTIIRQPFRG